MIEVSAAASTRFRCYKLLINNDEWREVHAWIIPLKSLALPKTFSSEGEFEAFWKDIEYRAAKSYGLKRLSKSAMTTFSFKSALKRYFISSETIDSLIESFRHLGLLDDSDWMQSFIRKEMRHLVGPMLIAEKLKAKGFQRDIVFSAIQNQYTEQEKSVILTKLIEKELKLRKKTVPEVVKRLVRKGFYAGEVLKYLKNDCVREG